MKKYNIEIREEYSRIITVEGIDEQDASDKLEEEYIAGNITFDKGDDFAEYNIFVHGEV